MILLGLTGSIGMGKSTTALMFADQGAPVYDADAAVHEVYGVGGAAVEPIEALFPGVAVGGEIDRARLSSRVLKDPIALQQLEAAVHPLLAHHRSEFMRAAISNRCCLSVFDIPLLFETGGDKLMDAVAVVSCPPDLQRQRVLSRPGMTEAKLDAILQRQTPDAEKRARADFIIETGDGLEPAQAQVRRIVEALLGPNWVSRRSR